MGAGMDIGLGLPIVVLMNMRRVRSRASWSSTHGCGQ
jgi:hypothetical protein